MKLFGERQCLVNIPEGTVFNLPYSLNWPLGQFSLEVTMSDVQT